MTKEQEQKVVEAIASFIEVAEFQHAHTLANMVRARAWAPELDALNATYWVRDKKGRYLGVDVGAIDASFVWSDSPTQDKWPLQAAVDLARRFNAEISE